MMISIGHGAYVHREKILLILPPNSSPAKRVIKEAEESRRLYDVTAGHKSRSVVVFEGCAIAISALQTKTLKARVNNPKPVEEDDETPGSMAGSV